MSERDKAHFPSEEFIKGAITFKFGALPKIEQENLNILEIRQYEDKEQLINHKYSV